MNIHLKKDILGVIDLLEKIQKNLVHVESIDERVQMLENCQQAAIALGEKIESNRIEDVQLIPMLEEYCELIYQLSQCDTIIPETEAYMALCSCLKEFRQHIHQLPNTYRVVFLPYKADMWDSLESIWKAFCKDKRFECHVVPIPYFEANQQTKQWEARYDGNRFPEYVPITNFEYYPLSQMQPDIAFVHNPFDNCNFVTSVHPDYYSEELKKYVKKLVYVPYYVNTGFISDGYKGLPLLHRADYIVVQSEKAKQSCKEQPYYNRVLPLGSPKIDKIINLTKEGAEVPAEWNLDLQGKKALMLNTTINDILNNGENLINKLQHFFEKVSSIDNVVIVWRPHPLLEGTVKAMRPEFIDRYNELVQYFSNNNIGVLDRTGDISMAVAATNGYIGSAYSSVVNLFAVCGKPIFLFDSNVLDFKSEIHAKPEDVFYKKDENDYFACRESENYTFDNFVEDLSNNRLEKVREKQMKAVEDLVANQDGSCGQKVHDYLVNEILKNY